MYHSLTLTKKKFVHSMTSYRHKNHLYMVETKFKELAVLFMLSAHNVRTKEHTSCRRQLYSDSFELIHCQVGMALTRYVRSCTLRREISVREEQYFQWSSSFA